MREKDTRAIDKMLRQRKSYRTVADELHRQGIELSPMKVYRYMAHITDTPKDIQKAIAKVLDCGVKEIF